MFNDEKRQVRKRTVIICVLMFIMALLSIVFGIAANSVFDVERIGAILSAIMASVFVLVAVVYFLSFLVRYRKMMAFLGDLTDDEMDSILIQAEPVDNKDIHMIYISDERILNFDTLNAYDMHSICSIKKASYTRRDNNHLPDTTYGIELNLNGSPSKDAMSFKVSTDRDSAYNIVIAACERYGIYVEKR